MPETFDSLVDLATVANDDYLLIRDTSASSNKDKRVTILKLIQAGLMSEEDAHLGAVETTSMRVADGGTPVTGIYSASGDVTFSGIAAGAAETQTLTVNGAAVGDPLSWTIGGAFPNGIVAQAWVSGSDTVSLRLYNATDSLIAGGTYTLSAAVISFS